MLFSFYNSNKQFLPTWRARYEHMVRHNAAVARLDQLIFLQNIIWCKAEGGVLSSLVDSENLGMGELWASHWGGLPVGRPSKTIRPLRRERQYPTNIVYNGSGELMTGDIIRRWEEFFEDLKEFTEDAEVDLFFQAEVTEVVRKPLSGKALGVDGSHPILPSLRSLDVVGLSWLARLCSITWQLGTVLYTLHIVLEGSRGFAQPVNMCFEDLRKIFYFSCAILWEMLWESAKGCRCTVFSWEWSGWDDTQDLQVHGHCLWMEWNEGNDEAWHRASRVVKKDLSQKAKLSLYWSINIPTPTYLKIVTKTKVAVYSQFKYVA